MIKIIIVGSSYVGKTFIFNNLNTTSNTPMTNLDNDDGSILNTSLLNFNIESKEQLHVFPYIPSAVPTFGLNVKVIKYNTNNNYVNVMLMDTCGLKMFRDINLQYINNMNMYVVVVDKNNIHSLYEAEQWIISINNHYRMYDKKILLVGNCIENNIDKKPIHVKHIDRLIQKYLNVIYTDLDNIVHWFNVLIDEFIETTYNSCSLPLHNTEKTNNFFFCF